MIKYVMGIVVVGEDKVLLQLKNRGGPVLEGRYNGLGGKIEEGERPIEAINREYKEESGDPNKLRWFPVGRLTDETNFLVHVYRAKVIDYYYDNFVFTSNDVNMEELVVVNVADLENLELADGVADVLKTILES